MVGVMREGGEREAGVRYARLHNAVARSSTL